MVRKDEVGMKMRVWLSLVVAFLGLGVVRGQGPTPAAANNPAQPLPLPTNNTAPPANGYGNGPAPNGEPSGPPSPGPGLSEWILYPRSDGCCGPVGKHGPISSEVYFRNGVSFPIGAGIFGSVMKPGYMIQGGVRSLFFNPAVDAAWTVDLGIVASWYDANDNSGGAIIRDFVLRTPNGQGGFNSQTIPEFPVTVSSVNHTGLNIGVGREWYLWGTPAVNGTGCCDGPRWRIGADLAGRYSSSKVVLFEIRHKTDTVGGLFGSLHTDLEIPTGCCMFQIGFRAEYGIMFSDILQSQNDTNMQQINLLIHLGLRF